MEWLLKLGVLYLSFNIFSFATAWFATVTIKPYCGKWWERHICAPYPVEFAMKDLRFEELGEARLRAIGRRQLQPKI